MARGFQAPVHLAPSTLDRSTALDWHARFEGAGLDGLIAKPRGGAYLPDKRSQLKLKHTRTLNVGGGRVPGSTPTAKGVGSLVVGLHDADGNLHHCGVTAGFTARRRAELAEGARPLRAERPEGTGSAPVGGVDGPGRPRLRAADAGRPQSLVQAAGHAAVDASASGAGGRGEVRGRAQRALPAAPPEWCDGAATARPTPAGTTR